MLQREFGIEFPLHLGYAEELPFEDASFDHAVSEYGAALFADPYRWIPEAARVLRPGGRLMFLTSGVILELTVPEYESQGPAGTTLLRPYLGIYRMHWPEEPAVEFHLAHGEMIRVLREAGLEVERLVEVRAPDDAVNDERWMYVTPEWARQWPSEEVWIARKGG